MSDLLILGVGPHALEMLDIVKRVNDMGSTWAFLGFVSLDESRVGEAVCGFPVLALTDMQERYPEAFVVPEYEWPHKSSLPRHRLASLIDPSVFVASTAHVGIGCVIYPHCYIGSNVSIGDFLFCLAGSTINHNDILEDRVTLTSGVTLAGDVHVEADCYLGQSCTVREMIRIGRGSLIGMGSVVLHDVARNSVIVGNPGRRLRSRQPTFPGAQVLRRAKQVARKAARTARETARGIKAQSSEALKPDS